MTVVAGTGAAALDEPPVPGAALDDPGAMAVDAPAPDALLDAAVALGVEAELELELEAVPWEHAASTVAIATAPASMTRRDELFTAGSFHQGRPQCRPQSETGEND